VSASSVRKSIAAGLTGVAGVAGSAVAVGLVSGQGAAWILFAIAAVQAVAGVLAVYSVPNGATLTQRVTELERVGVPALDKIVQAAQASPLPASVKQVATKVDEFVDKHAGVAASAPWPTTAPAPEPAPAPAPSSSGGF
jgi:hypothetical protein